ncbi:MAG: glycosyltransferase family 4 protein [Planctomycetota bacterium]
MNLPLSDQPMFPSFDSLEAILWPALALIVFVVTAVIVDVMIILSTRFRMVDLPNRRSAHALPTARGGGVAIVATAAMASLVAVYRWPHLAGRIMLGILLPSIVLAAVGVIDDIRPLRPVLRLGIQAAVAASMTAVLGPLTGIELPGMPPLEFGMLAWPLTLLWVVGLINAFNFMDGADGMAGLAAVVGGAGVAAVAYSTHSLATMLLAAFAAAAAAGFLVFNWQPARVFMGDVGSGFLGTWFAGLPLLVRDEAIQQTIVPIALCLWPTIYDPFMSVLRRIWNGANPLEPHREFLFHRLIRSGVSHSQAALIYGGMAALGGLLGLAMVKPWVPVEVRAWMPLGGILLAAALTYLIERRCRRVQLDAASQPVPAP